MFTQKELLKIVSKLHYNYGSFKVFIKISTNLGIKLCDSEILRDNNYDRQERASLVGLGPEVYGKFNLDINGKAVYGYYTEAVKVFNNYSDFTDLYKGSDLNEVKSELEKATNFNCFDVRWINVGIKNGKLILIDFDSNDDCWGSMAMDIIRLIDKL